MNFAKLFSLAFLLFLFGCSNTNTPKPLNQSVKALVYAYTSGVISKAEPIKIRFNDDVVSQDLIGSVIDKSILAFKPSIKGKGIWKDTKTIEFQPEEHLTSNTEFLSIVNLKSLFKEIPAEAEVFEFTFRTKEQFIDLRTSSFELSQDRTDHTLSLPGVLYTNDIADDQKVEDCLSAFAKSKQLVIQWDHQNGLEHKFKIQNILKGEEAFPIMIKWNGGGLGLKNGNGEKEIQVPALGEFKILDVQTEKNGSGTMIISFSEILDQQQNLEGLLTIKGHTQNMKYTIVGNVVRLYPGSKLDRQVELVAERGIKNANGMRMKNPASWTVSFEKPKPGVNLVGDGVIIPTSDGLIFPFEAENLSAVDVEVFKIFDSNIMQYLQTNTLEDGYSLKRVGRIILQTKVELRNLATSEGNNFRKRYALDLSEIIEADPGAIYQIGIAFRPQYVNINCEDENVPTVEIDDLDISKIDENKEYDSLFDGYYGLAGYYTGYSYDHRDNPCMPAYYCEEHFIKKNVFASDIGLIAKQGNNGSLHVIGSDILTARPIAGLEVAVYDFQQQLIKNATTDSEGILKIDLPREAQFVIATSGSRKAYLKLNDGSANSMSQFDTGGRVSQKGLKGHLYGERGVWRPGDSLYLNFVLESKNTKIPKNHPVTFELFDARGQSYTKINSIENVNNVYPFHIHVDEESPTGNWKAVCTVGGAKFSRLIKIETVKPNRLKINIDFGKKKLNAIDKNLNASLSAKWLHGAPAQNLEAKVEMQIKARKTKFSAFGNYVFDDPSRTFSSGSQVIFEDKVNSNGDADIKQDLSFIKNTPGKMALNFKTRVFEQGGDFSEDNMSITFSPYTSYAGIDIPKNKYNRKSINLEGKSNVSLIVLDENGNPISNRKLSVGLYKMEWSWWWDVDNSNISQFNSSDHINSESKSTVSTDQNGKATWTVSPETWGRYLLRVCDTEYGHCSGDFAYAGSPRWDDNASDKKAASMLAFVSDKQDYEVGEKITLSLPTAHKGRAFISIENGSEVLEHYWTDVASEDTNFSFYATDRMTPTIYANVTYLQPYAENTNDLPLRLYGAIPINVFDPKTKLDPVIKMADELKPEKKVSIEVSEASNKPMTYTLAVVDEGLLDLTRFNTPDLWNEFYKREALGVKTWDIYDMILGAMEGKMDKILAVGGDAEVEKNAKDKKANRFKPVVKHFGPFYLPAGSKKKHEFMMPNYIGSVKTMLVATQEGAYGSSEKVTPVKTALMVLPTLPRVLSPGEKLSLPINVFAMKDNVKSVKVSLIEESGLVSFPNGRTQNLNFSKPGEKMAYFDMNVSEKIGIGKFIFKVESGSESATQEIEIQIDNPNPIRSEFKNKMLKAGEEWQTQMDAIGLIGTNTAVLEISSVPPMNLESRLDYLLRYPHGCIEQTTSSGFPQLYVDQLLDLSESKKNKVAKNVKATISRLNKFTLSSGAFTYWPGSGSASDWGSTYAGHFLLEAKNKGYSVPSSLINNWVKYQKKVARSWKQRGEDERRRSRYSSYDLRQAYRLYTLALADEADLGSMNRMREEDISSQAKWRLAAAYALVGKKQIAKDMIKGLSTDIKPYRELSYSYGSDLRDQAMILETLNLLGDEDKIANLIRNISDKMSSEQWHSTQTIAYTLLAVGKVLGNSNSKSDFEFKYQLGSEAMVNAGSNKPFSAIEIPIEKVDGQNLKLVSAHSGVLFARFISSGKPLIGKEKSEENDLKIKVAYLDMNDKSIDISSLEKGTDFKAFVSVTNPGTRGMRYDELALSQVFPSGWEIHNSRMSEVSAIENSDKPEYQDIRDDRVYTYFDLNENESKTFAIQLNAAYQGRYYLPLTSCEAMYDNSITASKEGQWVSVE